MGTGGDMRSVLVGAFVLFHNRLSWHRKEHPKDETPEMVRLLDAMDTAWELMTDNERAQVNNLPLSLLTKPWSGESKEIVNG